MSENHHVSPLRCPVCRADFRSTRTCSRCGADLGPLMMLATAAWRGRQAARKALAAGQVAVATRHITTAQGLCASPAGEQLQWLVRWLQAQAPHSPRPTHPHERQ